MAVGYLEYDQETLRAVQLAELEILQEADRVCKQLEIPYILAFGTALGAKRHGGFIPWDDDIDIAMTRENYERFVEEAPALLGERFVFQSYPEVSDYPFAFAKICLKDTVFVEGYTEHLDIAHGIWLDVFSYDNFPDDPEQARAYENKAKKLLQLFTACSISKSYDTRGGVKVALKNRVRGALHAYMKNKDKGQAFDTLLDWTRRYNQEPTACMWSDYSSRWKVPRACVEQTEPILFEGAYYPAPKDIETYLECTYGDWKSLPPESERVGHMPIKLKLPTA